MVKAQERETALRRRAEDLNSRHGLKALLTTNKVKNRRATKKMVKASKEAAEIENIYKNLKTTDQLREEGRKNIDVGTKEAEDDWKRLTSAKDPVEASRIKNDILKKAYDAEHTQTKNVFGDKETGYSEKAVDSLQRDMIAKSGLLQEGRSSSEGHRQISKELHNNEERYNSRRKEIDPKSYKKDPELKKIREERNQLITKMDKQILKDMGLPITEENVKMIHWLAFEMVD